MSQHWSSSSTFAKSCYNWCLKVWLVRLVLHMSPLQKYPSSIAVGNLDVCHRGNQSFRMDCKMGGEYRFSHTPKTDFGDLTQLLSSLQNTVDSQRRESQDFAVSQTVPHLHSFCHNLTDQCIGQREDVWTSFWKRLQPKFEYSLYSNNSKSQYQFDHDA
jgi:hypothetical protein